MECLATQLQDAKLIKPKVFADKRGFFLESWQQQQYDKTLNHGNRLTFVQDNHSRSTQGVLRGLHFQHQFPQGKLVRVILGEIYDVIVDLRQQSPSFGKWQGFHLSAENKHLLWVPPGFAHGFYTLSDHAEMLYKCTDYYHPEDDFSILWNDSDLGIEWPLFQNEQPSLSEKDRLGLTFSEAPKFT